MCLNQGSSSDPISIGCAEYSDLSSNLSINCVATVPLRSLITFESDDVLLQDDQVGHIQWQALKR